MSTKLLVDRQSQMTRLPDPTVVSDAELDTLLLQIGLARFVGRVHSGLLPREAGYAAIERHAVHERGRPLVSQVVQALMGREDSYFKR